MVAELPGLQSGQTRQPLGKNVQNRYRKAELDLTWWRSLAGYAAKVCVVHSGGRISKIDRVGHIEELGSKLNRVFFANLELLSHGHVNGHNAVGVGDVCACVAKRVTPEAGQTPLY